MQQMQVMAGDGTGSAADEGSPGAGSEAAADGPPAVVTFVAGEASPRRFQLPVEAARRSSYLAQLIDSQFQVDTAPEDGAMRVPVNPTLFACIADFILSGKFTVQDALEFYAVQEAARFLQLEGVTEGAVQPLRVRMEIIGRQLVEQQCESFVSEVFTPWLESRVREGDTFPAFYVVPDDSYWSDVHIDPLVCQVLQDPTRRSIWVTRMERITGLRIDVGEWLDDEDNESFIFSTRVHPASPPLHLGDITGERDVLASADSAALGAMPQIERRAMRLMGERCERFVEEIFIPWLRDELGQGKVNFNFYIVPNQTGYPGDMQHRDLRHVLVDAVIWNMLEEPVRRDVWQGRMEELTGLRIQIGPPNRDHFRCWIPITALITPHFAAWRRGVREAAQLAREPDGNRGRRGGRGGLDPADGGPPAAAAAAAALGTSGPQRRVRGIPEDRGTKRLRYDSDGRDGRGD
eukprot:TRINITY_DN22112_c0_g1_i1.p1 TRINITY_DN22112_c0_g1~~TRINITY_DN22112_c0_g1_i1.p1  ORF type:complete len:463 (+),score=150.90 TRINITY_DN22112_c0_g1_i1:120-1508(+)